ncbi:MAG: FAD-linked oxidase [Melioribacteraceae bacterium]|nr:MAG: FAD-linked oxidase [Melioribacteraceae bacterium]
MLVKSDKNEILSYLSDAANFRGNAEKVYVPEKIEEVSRILQECFEAGTPVHISGMGTGLTGGRVPAGGVIVSTEKLNRIIEINKTEKFAIVESGVILEDFHKELKDQNLYYPPDPTEQCSSIGGNISNNASGAKTFKFGPTRDYVLALEVSLADGETVHLTRGEVFEKDGFIDFKSKNGRAYHIPVEPVNMPTTKNAAGYYMRKGMDAVDLFIGSEGTLGIILQAKLKLLPLPEDFLSMLLFFEDENVALKFVAELRDSSRNKKNEYIDALAIEFFDWNSLEFLRDDFPNIPEGERTALWIEQDVSGAESDNILLAYTELLEKYGVDTEEVWFATGDKERRELIRFRHAVSQKVSDFISRNNIRKVGTDLAVPDDKFFDFYHFCKNGSEHSGLKFIVYGHFGNSHIHLNMLPSNEDEYRIAKELYRELCAEAVKAGGTISAEHGIGKIKREYLKMMYSDRDLESMKKIKAALDTKNNLSPGNIFL